MRHHDVQSIRRTTLKDNYEPLVRGARIRSLSHDCASEKTGNGRRTDHR
jgi:hypothetical protein